MDLAELTHEIAEAKGSASLAGLSVERVVHDSRQVRPGDLFVALPGTHADGARFAHGAVRAGAVAVLAEPSAAGILRGIRVPLLQATSARRALGLLASRLHGTPSREVRVTGITGTNGKTTTAFLTSWILEAAGRRSGLLGTIVNRVGGSSQRARMTTPDAPELQAALAAARASGETDLVMEVSSHALDQERLAGTEVSCAVFTNLTRDHLDYHGSVAAYGAAKAKLFTQLSPDACAVLNARDPFSRELAEQTAARVVDYAWHLPGCPTPARVVAELHCETLYGTHIGLRLGREAHELALPLLGRFNVENALAAAAAAWAQGISGEQICAALEASQGVPGRLERVGARGEGPTVLVDYAHTPDALERVLSTLRPLVPKAGRLITVFGCGGERDRGKRAPMGRAVTRYADLAVLTNDNPRGEDPRRIARDVLRGCEGPVRTILDREDAIRSAIQSAGPQDLVLLAGKGHETEQHEAGVSRPFDDRLAAARALAA